MIGLGEVQTIGAQLDGNVEDRGARTGAPDAREVSTVFRIEQG